MANNKIIANGETLIDLTADTVTAGTMVSGTTAHDRSGASITGTFDPSVYVLKAGDTMSGTLHVPAVDSEYGNASDTRKEEYELDVHSGLEQKKYSNTSSMYGKQYSGSKLDNQYLTFNNGDYTNTYPVTKEVTVSQNGIEIVNSTSGTSKITELKDGTLIVSDRDLLTEIKAHTQYFATEIPANANLKTSTYLNAGRYVCRQTATAATLSNCPTGTAFNMDVDYPISLFNTVPSTWGYILRTITAADGKQWIQYVSIDGSGNVTWNDWVQLRASTNGGNVIKQIRTNDANEYQLLFTEVVGRDSDIQLSRTRKNECLYYKPSSGELHLERASGITSNIYAYFIAGNSKIAGTDTGANAGVLRLYGQKQYYAHFADTNNVLTANRTYSLPNKDGELAILQDAELNVENRNVVSRGVNEAKYIGFATKAGGSCYLHYSAAGNHGILSSGYESSLTDTSTYTAGQIWIIERLGASGNVTIPNWANKGSASKPVYFNSSGYPVAGNETVNKAGDRMSGSLNIDNAIMNVHRDCGVDMYLQAYNTGNQGLYSSGYYTDATNTSTYTSSGKWIIRRNSAGNVYVDEWASIGGSQTPVYLNSNGRPTAVSTTSGSGTASTTYINTGSANYAERCGIVSVSFNFKTKGTADTNKILFTSLPKPKIDTYAVLQGGASATYRHLVVKINTSGQAVVAGDVSDNNITWMGSVTYPVA